jgi:uncharacterized membrane protein
MTDAHLHLVVNHFPIIGTILGLGVLLAGILFKSNTIKNVSYVLFIVAAIFAYLSTASGGGAAHAVKNMPNITKEIIHEHAEMAETFALVLYVLGTVSLLGLFANIKKHSKANLVCFLAVVIAAIAAYVAQQVGTSGGEIRHTEIRKDYKPVNTETEEYEDKE